jgi:hypothetical protein
MHKLAHGRSPPPPLLTHPSPVVPLNHFIPSATLHAAFSDREVHSALVFTNLRSLNVVSECFEAPENRYHPRAPNYADGCEIRSVRRLCAECAVLECRTVGTMVPRSWSVHGCRAGQECRPMQLGQCKHSIYFSLQIISGEIRAIGAWGRGWMGFDTQQYL